MGIELERQEQVGRQIVSKSMEMKKGDLERAHHLVHWVSARIANVSLHSSEILQNQETITEKNKCFET